MSIETYSNVLTSDEDFMAEIEIETAAEITSMESYAHSTLRELDYEHSGHTGFAGIKYGTTAEWEAQSSYIPAKNVIIIYTDYAQTEDEKPVYGIKVGDGVTPVSDLTFVTDSTSEALSKEIERSVNEDIDLQYQINEEHNLINTLRSDLNTEISTREAEDESISTALLQESADRQVEDLRLSNLINQTEEDLSDHKLDKNNPHEVTKEQVGLGNVENIAPENMPISADTQAALDLKVDQSVFETEVSNREDADSLLNLRLMALEYNVPGYITKDVDNLTHYYDIDVTNDLLEQKQDCIEDITNGDIDNLF